MSRDGLATRLTLSEWLADHPACVMQRSWMLTEQQRRRIVAVIKAEVGEPQVEHLLPIEALNAMQAAADEHGLVVLGAE